VIFFCQKISETRRLLRRSHWPENNDIRAMVQKAGIQLLKKIKTPLKKIKDLFGRRNGANL
jgi:hypothetical protein